MRVIYQGSIHRCKGRTFPIVSILQVWDRPMRKHTDKDGMEMPICRGRWSRGSSSNCSSRGISITRTRWVLYRTHSSRIRMRRSRSIIRDKSPLNPRKSRIMGSVSRRKLRIMDNLKLRIIPRLRVCGKDQFRLRVMMLEWRLTLSMSRRCINRAGMCSLISKICQIMDQERTVYQWMGHLVGEPHPLHLSWINLHHHHPSLPSLSPVNRCQSLSPRTGLYSHWMR